MLNQLNIQIFNAINQFAGSNVVLDKFMIVVAKYLPFLFVLFLLFLWFRINKTKEVVLYAGYSAILGVLLNFLIGLFYFHPRPFMEHIGNTLINHIAETSFPSDHTTFMLSIAFMLLYFKKTRNAGVVLFVLGLFGGISRIYCGLHYPFDIFGSLIVSLVGTAIIYFFRDKLQFLNGLVFKIENIVFKRD